jgi:hypothetical protein
LDLASKRSRGEAVAKALSEGYTSALDETRTGPDVNKR